MTYPPSMLRPEYPSAEGAALHAVIDEDYDEARRILQALNPRELSDLIHACTRLSELARTLRRIKNRTREEP